MTINIGDLRQLVTLQNEGTPSVDAYGSETPNWTTYAADQWADIKQTGGTEFYRGMRLLAQNTHVVTIRYSTGVTSATDRNMRVIYDGRIFEIRAVMDVDEMGQWFLLDCKEDTSR
jgi:SPP1 family predicted phage head-tail adaptor